MGTAHERHPGEARALADGGGDVDGGPADRPDDSGVEAAGEPGRRFSLSFDLGVVIVACYGLAMLPAIIQAIRWW